MPRVTLLALVALLVYASPVSASMPADLAAGAKRAGMPADGLESVESAPVAWIYEPETGGRQVTVVALAKLPAPAKTIVKNLKSSHGVLQSEAMRQMASSATRPAPKTSPGIDCPTATSRC